MTDSRKTVLLITLICAGIALSVLSVTIWIHGGQVECDRRVDTRDDLRAVWLHLVDANTNTHPDEVASFLAYLDTRLPQLECTGTFDTHARPIGEP